MGYVWCDGYVWDMCGVRYVWDMCGVRYANNLLKNPATKRLSGKTKDKARMLLLNTCFPHLHMLQNATRIFRLSRTQHQEKRRQEDPLENLRNKVTDSDTCYSHQTKTKNMDNLLL